MAQGPSFMDELKKHDSEFFDLVSAVEAKALGPGALDRKTKTLILLAIMAVGGVFIPGKAPVSMKVLLPSRQSNLCMCLLCPNLTTWYEPQYSHLLGFIYSSIAFATSIPFNNYRAEPRNSLH